MAAIAIAAMKAGGAMKLANSSTVTDGRAPRVRLAALTCRRNRASTNALCPHALAPHSRT